MPNQESTVSESSPISQEQYKHQFLTVLIPWSIAIVAMVLFMLVFVLFEQPSVGLYIMLGAFSIKMCTLLWSQVNLGREHISLIARMYLVSALIPTVTFGLLLSGPLSLVGIMGYMLLNRTTVLLEDKKFADLYLALCVTLYVVGLTLRHWLAWPLISLGVIDFWMLLILPILVFLLFIFIDRVATSHLQKALLQSEVARHKMEQAFHRLEIQASELQQVNDEVKAFTYIVSHDLRAPLINLKGFAGEMREAWKHIEPVATKGLTELEGKQKEEVAWAIQEDVPEALQFIDASASRMDGLINALLQLSRLGRRELNYQRINMDELVNNVTEALTHQIKQSDTSITIEPMPAIVTDEVAMEQIFGNLLNNAVNYLQPERPGHIKITAEATPDEYVFAVQDNGRGIAESDMPKVFAPFRRIGRTGIPGEGMGLAYVQTLVRRLGGQITCTSEPGVGTTFTFTILRQTEVDNNDGKLERS